MSGPLVLSFKVATTLAAQRIVTCMSSTAHTVGYPEAATGGSVLPIGITLDTVKDTTSSIPVQVNGIAKLYFNDTVTSGKFVMADTSGRGIPFTPAVTATAATLLTGVIGLLVGPKVDLTGTIADVLIQPQLIR